MLQLIEPHQTLELVCKGQITVTFGFEDLLQYLADQILIQRSISMTCSKEIPGVTSYLFVLVHGVPNYDH